MSDFKGATLALQHYYDITDVSRTLPFLTLYRANEQPFGRRMSVWMESETLSPKLTKKAHERLEAAMLKNRAVNTAHALRILDFGTGEGHSFVVTDELKGSSLYDYLQAHGPLAPWQFLRLAEQLTDIVEAAHSADFHFLCMTSKTIFVSDEKRFEITTSPLGIALHRADLLTLKDTPITPDLMRHLPPWEFVAQIDENKDEKIDGTTDDAHRSDSVQNLDDHLDSDLSLAAAIQDEMEDSEFDPDVYATVELLYEAISGQHPYFPDGSEICDAVLTMQRTSPAELVSATGIPDAVCQRVTESLKKPQKGTLLSLLSTLQKALGEETARQALCAEKHYMQAPELTPAALSKPLKKYHIPYPKFVLPAAALLLIILTAFITHHFSSQRHPVDLFALPEILPAASEGVDVVLPLPKGKKNVSVYLSSFADGSLIRLGALPLIYRDQTPSSRLNFVISDERGHTEQLPVIVRDEPGLQIVDVDRN